MDVSNCATSAYMGGTEGASQAIPREGPPSPISRFSIAPASSPPLAARAASARGPVKPIAASAERESRATPPPLAPGGSRGEASLGLAAGRFRGPPDDARVRTLPRA